MAAAWIVEALDELEDRASRLGLRLEPAACQQLAFKRGKEALAHGVVICIANRAHRGTHAGLAATLAELDRRVLRTLVGVMDHVPWPPRCERHVQSIQHQLFGEGRGHRPANDATAVRIEHYGE